MKTTERRPNSEAPHTDAASQLRFDMTFRNYILFGLALFVILTAGFIFAFSGIAKLLAAAMALAIVGPMWMIGRPGWTRQRLDDRPQENFPEMNPQVSLIIWAVGFCATAWSTTRYYQRADWMGVVINSVLTLWFLYRIYLEKQRWSKLKQSEHGSPVA